jgi:hypothetical protein
MMRLLRITMAFMLASGVAFASFLYWQGSRPMGEISSTQQDKLSFPTF